MTQNGKILKCHNWNNSHRKALRGFLFRRKHVNLCSRRPWVHRPQVCGCYMHRQEKEERTRAQFWLLFISTEKKRLIITDSVREIHISPELNQL